MSSSSYFLVCVSALLVQNALCQVPNFGLPNRNLGVNTIPGGVGFNGVAVGNALNPGLAANGLGYPGFPGVPNVAATASVPITGPFTSTGNAEMTVGGEFGVGGQTVIGGQIPVIGAVSFSGQIPAGGVVSIAGNCGCANVPL